MKGTVHNGQAENTNSSQITAVVNSEYPSPTTQREEDISHPTPYS